MNHNLILCVKSDMMERMNKVQKNIKLEEIINSGSYMDIKDCADNGYIPLTVGVTIRDLETNKVLVKRDGDIKRTFIYLENINPLIHKGYDLIMYLSSVGVTSLLKDKNQMINFSCVMAKSVFDVNGLLWMKHNEEPNCILLNPMVMTTIFVDSKELSKYLIPHWKFENIADIKLEKGFIKCIIDDLIEMKGASKDE